MHMCERNVAYRGYSAARVKLVSLFPPSTTFSPFFIVRRNLGIPVVLAVDSGYFNYLLRLAGSVKRRGKRIGRYKIRQDPIGYLPFLFLCVVFVRPAPIRALANVRPALSRVPSQFPSIHPAFYPSSSMTSHLLDAQRCRPKLINDSRARFACPLSPAGTCQACYAERTEQSRRFYQFRVCPRAFLPPVAPPHLPRFRFPASVSFGPIFLFSSQRSTSVHQLSES